MYYLFYIYYILFVSFFKIIIYIRIYPMWLDLMAFIVVCRDRPLKYLIKQNHLMIYQDWLPLRRFSQMK